MEDQLMRRGGKNISRSLTKKNSKSIVSFNEQENRMNREHGLFPFSRESRELLTALFEIRRVFNTIAQAWSSQ
jgi:hypothetical protein